MIFLNNKVKVSYKHKCYITFENSYIIHTFIIPSEIIGNRFISKMLYQTGALFKFSQCKYERQGFYNKRKCINDICLKIDTGINTNN